jgi:hypothetical protein
MDYKKGDKMEVDYKRLVEKVNELGELLGDAINIRRRYRCTKLL